MKLDRNATINSLANSCYATVKADTDMTQAEAAYKIETTRLSKLNDADLLKAFLVSDRWRDDFGQEGFTPAMVKGFDAEHGLSFEPNEVKAIILKDEDYGFDVFVQPINPDSGEMISYDQGGWITGFDNLEENSDGSSEFSWWFDGLDKYNDILAELTRIGVSFVERDMSADDAYEFENN